jgi:Tfp pilus assembly protein PilF
MEHALEVDSNNYVADENLVVYFSRIGDHKNVQLHFQRATRPHPTLSGATLAAPGGQR